MSCISPDEAVFGACGAGDNPDCGTEVWVGVQCCKTVIVDEKE